MKQTTIALLGATFWRLSSLSAQQPAPDPLLRWMDQIAQRQLQQRENAISEIRSVPDAEGRKQFVRETFRVLIGGLPAHNRPLNPRISGRIVTGDHTNRNGSFESTPG